jgi:hypothetical protein
MGGGDGVRLSAVRGDIRDTALYHSVLAAVAQGHTTRGGIAGYIGRKAADISHPLNVLEDSHLLTREADVFRAGKSTYRITEPLITFYGAMMRPSWDRLESGQAAEVWARSAERFAAQVAGPHFEALCREYLLGAGRSRLGAGRSRLAPPLGQVGSGVDTTRCVLACLGAGGFSDALRAAAEEAAGVGVGEVGRVLLIGPEELYGDGQG